MQGPEQSRMSSSIYHKLSHSSQSSNIEAHRNSIEQRIANLEAKIMQKGSSLPQEMAPHMTFNSFNRAPVNPILNHKVDNHNQPSFDDSYTHNHHRAQVINGKHSLQSSARKSIRPFDTVENKQEKNFRKALEEKQLQENTLPNQPQPRKSLKSKNSRSKSPTNLKKLGLPDYGKPSKNATKRVFNENLAQNAYQSTKRQSKRELDQLNLKRTQPLLSGIKGGEKALREMERLSQTISNLRLAEGQSLMESTGQSRNTGSQPQVNSELYDMMKSIIEGQRHLENELSQIKQSYVGSHRQVGNQQQALDDSCDFEIQNITSLSKTKKAFNSTSKSPVSAKSQSKRVNVPRSLSRSKSPIRKSASPFPNCSPKPTGKRSGKIARNRAITKNKTNVSEMIRIARKSMNHKTVPPSAVSTESISRVWERIERVIKVNQKEGSDSANISHENNRYINDHLNNTINLQKKLKGDLLSKIYNMANKCTYK